MYKKNWVSAALLSLSLVLLPPGLVEANDGVKIGISVSDLSNPYFRQLARAVEAEATRLRGKADVQVVSSAYDIQRQSRQLQRFFADGYNILLLSAASYDGLTQTIEGLRAQGAQVIAVDVAAEGVDATITTNNFQAGTIACQYIAQMLNGSGTVGVINGPQVS